MKKLAIVSVINDLNTDRRVHRTCIALQKLGYDVLLIGRKLPASSMMEARPYKCIRMQLLFKKGPLFYLFFNIRLFFKILSYKPTLLYANDLDTLLANALISKFKACKLIYDSHEYFTEVPELSSKNIKKNSWKWLENKLIPKANGRVTVNQSIANRYKSSYGLDFKVIRNIPEPLAQEKIISPELELNGRHMIILQGSGINIDRGAEEAVKSMQYVNNAVLFIIGGGDVFPLLKKLVNELTLNDKVRLISKLPYHELLGYTKMADIGLSIDKDTNLNYKYSLPNKVFDYLNCGVAVLASKLPELQRIIEKYDVGAFIDSHEPKQIAEKINFMLADEKRLLKWRSNCALATTENNWIMEEAKLIKLIKEVE